MIAYKKNEEFASYKISQLINSNFDRKPWKSRAFILTSSIGLLPIGTLVASALLVSLLPTLGLLVPAPFVSLSSTLSLSARAPANTFIYLI